MNYIIWRVQNVLRYPVASMHAGRRLVGATLIPCARVKHSLEVWDVTVPDRYADSHMHEALMQIAVTDDQSAVNKLVKLEALEGIHSLFSVSIETAG